MATRTVKLPDGRSVRVNLPDAATPDQIEEFLNGPDFASIAKTGVQAKPAAPAKQEMARSPVPAQPALSDRPGAKGGLAGFIEGTKDIAASHALNVGGGLVEGVVGAAGLAIDTTADVLTGGPIRRFVKGVQTGEFKHGPELPITQTVTRAVDDAIKTGKEVLDVKSDTHEMDALSRFAGNVIAPGPELIRGKTAPMVKTEKAAAEIVTPAAEEAAKPAGPVEKVIQALKEAKPLRAEQEAIYTKKRGERIKDSIAARQGTSGEAGFRAELAALKGEMPKVQFESLRGKIGQEEIDGLFNTVRDTDVLTEWQKLGARKGLAKIFGEYGGQVPTEGELALMRKVFGQEFTTEVLAHQPMLQRFKEFGLDAANVPRAVMSSFDLSAPFRQGVFFIGRPKQFFPAFREMFKAFGSEKAYEAIQEAITKRPSFELMDESGLAITDMGGVATREERFSSNLAEKIPLLGVGVRSSGRAYNAFLTKLRADVFDDLITKATAQGLDPENDLALAKSIAKFVNVGTGRGDLPAFLAGAGPFLNTILFSPKLMSSRLTLLNPMYYVKQPPFVRKEALKSMLSFAGTGATVASLAKLAGADVSLDPRGSDFGKIRIGNTRIDVWGGFQQYIRMATQLATGEYKSATSGKEYTLGEGYKPTTRYDILLRQVESKLAPLPSFATTILKQQNYKGEPVSIPKEVAERFTPMVVTDMIELAKDDPSLMPLAGLATFGVGVQNFRPTEKEVGRRE